MSRKKKRRLIQKIIEELQKIDEELKKNSLLEAELDDLKRESSRIKASAQRAYEAKMHELNLEANVQIFKNPGNHREIIEEMVSDCDKAQETLTRTLAEENARFDRERHRIYESHGLSLSPEQP